MSADVEYWALKQIAERANAAVGADRCTIYTLEPDGKELLSRVALGLNPGVEIRVPITRGAVGFVARTGRPLRLRDAYTDPRFDPSIDEHTGYRTRTLITMPVKDSDGSVIGVLQLINKRSGAFSVEDERALAPYCTEAAAALAG